MSRQLAPTTARRIAFEVLRRVYSTSSHSTILLNAILRKNADLQAVERRLATELVFGVLRNITLLDYYLNEAGSFSIKRTSIDVLTALRLGAYQVIFLSKTPDFASVSQTVEIAKEVAGKKTAGFVNALLRRLVEKHESISPPEIGFDREESEFIKSVALVFSFPVQLLSRWRSHTSREELVRMVAALNQAPPGAIRVNKTRTTPDALQVLLESRGFEVQPSPICPNALRLSRGGAAENTPEWASGHFSIQDEGPQVLGLLLNAENPRTVGDICAGIGQKSTHLAELFPNSRILGSDISVKKMQECRRQSQRLGLDNLRLLASDALNSPLRPNSFDLILVDAPCTGTGTIRRRPEIRWRFNLSNLKKLATLQLNLLESCKGLISPGGLLIYSTCSIEPDENERVVAKFLKQNSSFKIAPLDGLPEQLSGASGKMGITLRPHLHDCDGMFFSLIRRSR
ncbi:MAG: 16S rRNA (cytosine(967)-C(5))-methyltransferase RsmB [Candidatus Coatesbacteria bacterium]|nr:16S rRNA (cytosine(967)-C(5))-methyltransferase RsmB [Candidatus Coatesbacteria bacterium]